MNLEKRLWLESLLFSFVILLLFTLYTFAFYQKGDLYIFNKIFANASVVLISLSMGLASYSYFFPKLLHYLEFRKYLGLTGFYFVLAHAAIILLLQNRFPFPVYFFQQETIAAFLFALASSLVLLVMAVVSHSFIRKRMKPRIWRRILRLGHLALVLGLIHFGIKSSVFWIDWLTYFFPIFPPPSLIAFLVGVATIALRILMELSQRGIIGKK